MAPVVVIAAYPFGKAAAQGQAVFKREKVKVLILRKTCVRRIISVVLEFQRFI